MNLVSLKCPSCGANIYIDDKQDSCFCSHCGTQIKIDDPNKKEFTYTKVDAARIKEAETYENIRQRELDLEERRLNKERNILIIKVAIILFAILAIAGVIMYIAYLSHIDEDFGETLAALAFLLICVVGAVSFFWVVLKNT